MILRLMVLAVAFSFAACSHAPPKKLDPESSAGLTIGVRQAVSDLLKSRKDFVQMNEFVMGEPEVVGGLTRMSYRLSYDSVDKEHGRVTHRIEKIMVLERESANAWRVKETEPVAQTLVFHDGARIEVR